MHSVTSLPRDCPKSCLRTGRPSPDHRATRILWRSTTHTSCGFAPVHGILAQCDLDTSRRSTEQVPRPACPGTAVHSPTWNPHHDGSEPCLQPHGSKSKEQHKDDELKLLLGVIDCFLPQPARLSCAVQSSPQQVHMPSLTDSAWHEFIDLLFHWRVEECASNVVDTKTRW